MRERPTAGSIRAIVDLLVYLEKQYACGPWDHWDGDLLHNLVTNTRLRLFEALEAATPPRDGPDQPCPFCHQAPQYMPALQLRSGL